MIRKEMYEKGDEVFFLDSKYLQRVSRNRTTASEIFRYVYPGSWESRDEVIATDDGPLRTRLKALDENA